MSDHNRLAGGISIGTRRLRAIFVEQKGPLGYEWTCRLDGWHYVDNVLQWNDGASIDALYSLTKHLRGHLSR